MRWVWISRSPRIKELEGAPHLLSHHRSPAGVAKASERACGWVALRTCGRRHKWYAVSHPRGISRLSEKCHHVAGPWWVRWRRLPRHRCSCIRAPARPISAWDNETCSPVPGRLGLAYPAVRGFSSLALAIHRRSPISRPSAGSIRFQTPVECTAGQHLIPRPI